MKVEEKAIEILKDSYICDICLGRQFGDLLTGYTNEQRGKIIRQFMAFLIDSGEKIDVDLSNFYGIRFRNVKIKPEKPKKCKICKNFFLEKLGKIAKSMVKEFKGIEFDTFQVGSIVSDDLLKLEEEQWNRVGIEFCEPIKSEINRELGKAVEKLTKKRFAQKNPDVTAIVNLNTGTVRVEIRSLYIFGGYQKLKRGIPQTKWVCRHCNGKGCKNCKGKGKLYSTSVQEIIEKPLLKITKSKKSSFHGAGREDIDARCLDYRPFVIEIEKPIKRKVDLKWVERQIGKSGKVKVKGLRFATKDAIRKIKFAKIDKTYLATVEFAKSINKKKLRGLRILEKKTYFAKNPFACCAQESRQIQEKVSQEDILEIDRKEEIRVENYWRGWTLHQRTDYRR